MNSEIAYIFWAGSLWVPPVHFDWSIGLGTIVVCLTFVGTVAVAYHKGMIRIVTYVTQLTDGFKDHSKKLEEHSERMQRYEARANDISNELQYLIGLSGGERRGSPRRLGH